MVEAESSARFAPTGYLLFVQEEMLLAQPFDTTRNQLTGEPIPLVEHVSQTDAHQSNFSVSGNGVLTYLSADPRSQLIWFDREGKQLRHVGSPGQYRTLSLSTDDKCVLEPIRGWSTLSPESNDGRSWLASSQKWISIFLVFVTPPADAPSAGRPMSGRRELGHSSSSARRPIA